MDKELREWVDARAWTTGDGPKAIFLDAVRWLRERDVLLPGVTTLARLVAQARDEAYQRLWDTLHGMLSDGQRRLLGSLAVVPEGERISQLERWRKGPAKASGLNMVKALARVSQVTGTGFGQLDLEAAIPARSTAGWLLTPGPGRDPYARCCHPQSGQPLRRDPAGTRRETRHKAWASLHINGSHAGG